MIVIEMIVGVDAAHVVTAERSCISLSVSGRCRAHQVCNFLSYCFSMMKFTNCMMSFRWLSAFFYVEIKKFLEQFFRYVKL